MSGPDSELQRLRDIETEVCALLRAIDTESKPSASLAESIITQHHLNQLAKLTQPQPEQINPTP